MQYTLRDGRALVIEKGRKEDAADMIAYMNRVGGESDNLTFGKDGCRYTLEMEEAFLERIQHEITSTALLGRVAGELVSIGTLGGNPRERVRHNCDLGISVRKDYWRLGIGELMMKAMIRYAQDTGVLRVIHLGVRADNAGAIALYEKLGFVRIGVHRGEMCVDGHYYDILLMDLHL